MFYRNNNSYKYEQIIYQNVQQKIRGNEDAMRKDYSIKEKCGEEINKNFHNH